MFGRKTSHNSKDDGGWQSRSLTRKNDNSEKHGLSLK